MPSSLLFLSLAFARPRGPEAAIDDKEHPIVPVFIRWETEVEAPTVHDVPVLPCCAAWHSCK